MPPPTTPALVSGGGLFVDYKKGEIPELKNLLRDSAVDKDPKTKRALMERVVGYMTLGNNLRSCASCCRCYCCRAAAAVCCCCDAHHGLLRLSARRLWLSVCGGASLNRIMTCTLTVCCPGHYLLPTLTLTGIDMSPLFSEMIMATATKDLVQKKMCYLYLSNYASLQVRKEFAFSVFSAFFFSLACSSVLLSFSLSCVGSHARAFSLRYVCVSA